MSLDLVLNQPRRLALLVGAGISMDAPSNLLSGLGFMRCLLQQIAPSGPIRDSLLSYLDAPGDTSRNPALRFESLMEIIRSSVDKDLHVLNCLADCRSYNLKHLAVAALIHQGATVLTTNFDVLIEHAFLAQFGAAPLTVLGGDGDPSLLPDPRKGSLFKVHGSLLRWTGNEWVNSRETVRATLRHVAAAGEGFQLEPRLRRVIRTGLEANDLIVAGYSGSDDFDVLPLLRSVRSTRRLVWVSHADDRKEPHFSPLRDLKEDGLVHLALAERTRLLGLLSDLAEAGAWAEDQIILVQANTGGFLHQLAEVAGIATDSMVPSEPNRWDAQAYFDGWMRDHVFQGGVRELMAARVFSEVHAYQEAIELYRQSLESMDEELGKLKSEAHLDLGGVHAIRGEFPLAEKHGRAALHYKSADSDRTAEAFGLLGKVAYYRGDYDVAQEHFEAVLRIAAEELHPGLAADALHYLARLWQARGQLQEAEELYSRADELYSRLGHLRGNALSLHQLGHLYLHRKQYARAREYFHRAMGLRRLLNDKLGIAATLHELGWIEYFEGSIDQAVELILRSLRIEEEIGHLRGISDSAETLGFFYLQRHQLREAHAFYERSLKLDLELGRIEQARQTLAHLEHIRQELGGHFTPPAPAAPPGTAR